MRCQVEAEAVRIQGEPLLNYHVVAERDLRLLNPATAEDIVRLGEVCGLKPRMRILDMGSGKGEPAFILAGRFGVDVVGVDHMEDFVEEAQARAKLLRLQDGCRFVLGEGEAFEIEREAYDVGMALGTTFIYGGFRETLQALSRGVKRRGFLVVGEPYWKRKPVPKGYLEAEGIRESDNGSDWQNAETIRSVGGELVHVFHADGRSWDHYETSHWRAVEEWAYENPKHPQRKEFLERMQGSRDSYLRWGRDYLGWAIYVSRIG